MKSRSPRADRLRVGLLTTLLLFSVVLFQRVSLAAGLPDYRSFTISDCESVPPADYAYCVATGRGIPQDQFDLSYCTNAQKMRYECIDLNIRPPVSCSNNPWMTEQEKADWCALGLGELHRDAERCRSIRDGHLRDTCFAFLAYDQADESLCDGVSDYARDPCRTEAIIAKDDPVACAGLLNPETCYWHYAITKPDFFYCTKLNDPQYIQSCGQSAQDWLELGDEYGKGWR